VEVVLCFEMCFQHVSFVQVGRESARGGEAHVLNDEVQRKYIQSVKRLISFCARKFPADKDNVMYWLS
jgi:hypothetical protein